MKRPLGVTVIGILDLIGGIAGIVGGLALLGIGGILVASPEFLEGSQTNLNELKNNLFNFPPELLGAVFLALGGMLLAIGIVSLIVAYGIFRGKGWAWTTNIVIAYVGIAMNIISLVITASIDPTSIASTAVSIAISIVILYYLYRPHVKQYFGKATSAAQVP
jgi:hypothetical protein